MKRRSTLVEPPHLALDLKTLGLPAVAASWERMAIEAERKRQTHPDYLAERARLDSNQGPSD